MVGILAHFHVQLHFENRKLFIFWIFFFSWKFNPIFFSQLQPDPENIDIGTVVDTWLQEFIGFFFLVEGGRLFVLFFLCLQQLFVYNFFYYFKILLYVTDCVLCPSYGIHTWFNISRALTFVFTEFFLFILVQFFCFVFNFWWASSSTKKILRILILDRKCWGQIDIFGFGFILVQFLFVL